MSGRCPLCGHVDPLEQARSIIAEIAIEHEIPRMAIIGRDKHPGVVSARVCAIRRIRKETSLYLKQIGDLFDGRNYSTIIYHLNGKSETAAAAAPG